MALTTAQESSGLLTATPDYQYNNRMQPSLRRQNLPSPCEYASAYASLLCHYHPFLCALFVLLVSAFFLLVIANLALNPLQEFGKISPSLFASIHSKSELSTAKIDHRCLEERDNDCICKDPLIPSIPDGDAVRIKQWQTATQLNQKTIEKSAALHNNNAPLDVAFLGGSIVEAMNGRWLGSSRSTELAQSLVQFFAFKSNTSLKCVALGVAGDTSPNVLWRLLHGEMPNDFNPRIWWLVLGMNDLGMAQCSEEMVVLGILRIVEEILERKPHAEVVINLLFPMIDLRDAESYPALTDFERSLHHNGKHVAPDFTKTKQELDSSSRSVSRTGDKGDSRDEVVMYANQHKVRKYRPLAGFAKRKTLPLWTSILAINKELAAFANKHDRVHAFDPIPIFSRKQHAGKYILIKAWVTGQGHLTPRGYEVWLNAVGTTLRDLDVSHPHLVLADDDAVPEVQSGASGDDGDYDDDNVDDVGVDDDDNVVDDDIVDDDNDNDVDDIVDRTAGDDDEASDVGEDDVILSQDVGDDDDGKIEFKQEGGDHDDENLGGDETLSFSGGSEDGAANEGGVDDHDA